MHTSISKKLLAGVLSAVMVVSLFAGIPANNVDAAASAKVTGKTSVYTGKTYKYTVANVTKKQYVKVSVSGKASTTVKYNKKAVKASKKISGGKNIVLYVKNTKSAGKSYTLTVKVYNNKNKVVKTLKKTAKVYAKTTAVTVDPTEATVKVGETATLTATTTPAKNTKKVTWKSSDEAVATVADGVVTAVAAGTATITATSGEKSATATVKVVEALAAKQTGAKTFTVTGDATVLKDAKISVTRGTANASCDVKVTDNTAVITMNTNIVEEEYTISVNDEKLVVKGEVAKLTKIEILGEIAIAAQALPTADTSGTATAAYKATNQFEEDITKTTSIETSSTDITVANGVITFALKQGAKEGDLLPVVLVNKETGIAATATLKLSAQSAVAEVAMGALYNADGKTLSEDTNLTKDAFYQLVELKDQYGNEIVDTAKANEVLVTFIPGITGLRISALTNVTVDGKKKLGYQLEEDTDLRAGEASLLVIAKATGKSDKASFTVANGVKLDKFTVSPADMIISGEKAKFNFTAIDNFGNEIANPTQAMFAQFPAHFAFVKDAKTGKSVLEYNAQAAGPQVAVFMTATNQVATVSFTVKEAAYPVAVVGLKDVATSILVGDPNTVVITPANVVLEDNYGREVTADNFPGVDLVVSASAEPEALSVVPDQVDETWTEVVITADAEKAQKNEVTFTLTVGGKANSKSFAVESVGIESLKSFEVADVALVRGYTGAAVTPIEVIGLTAAGKEVVIPTEKYTAIGASVAGNALDGADFLAAETAKHEIVTKDAEIAVVIDNVAGTEIKKTFKVSNAPAVATTVKTGAVTTYKNASGTTVTAANLVNLLKVKDQYGDDLAGATPRVFVELVDGDKFEISKNNTAIVELSAEAGKSATVKVTFKFSATLEYTDVFGVATKDAPVNPEP